MNKYTRFLSLIIISLFFILGTASCSSLCDKKDSNRSCKLSKKECKDASKKCDKKKKKCCSKKKKKN